MTKIFLSMACFVAYLGVAMLLGYLLAPLGGTSVEWGVKYALSLALIPIVFILLAAGIVYLACDDGGRSCK